MKKAATAAKKAAPARKATTSKKATTQARKPALARKTAPARKPSAARTTAPARKPAPRRPAATTPLEHLELVESRLSELPVDALIDLRDGLEELLAAEEVEEDAIRRLLDTVEV